MWKLIKVYENPIGNELDSFSTQPYQYIVFNRDSTFVDYRSAYDEREPQITQGIKEKLASDPVQFVLSQGFLFFYRNSAIYDTEACFVVANRSDPFQIGQMLLMPPADQTGVTGRRVKVFEKATRADTKGGNNNQRRQGRHHRKRNNQNQ